MTLTGKANKKIVFVTAYRVCNTTTASSGDCTSYMQQFRTLLAYNNTKKISTPQKPHRQFVLDLQAWLEMLQSEGSSVIIGLDANKDISSTSPVYCPLTYNEGTFIKAPQHNGHMSTLLTSCGLIDTLSFAHPPPYPSPYSRGCHHLDYILISKDLLPELRCSGVLPLYSVFLGDHCPCYIDLDGPTMFGSKTHPIAPELSVASNSLTPQNQCLHLHIAETARLPRSIPKIGNTGWGSAQ
jgi:hypothetical protein